MIQTSIHTAFKLAKIRNWDTIYWAIDLHGVIIKPTYSNDIPDTFYDDAIAVLQKMSNRPDFCLILYTCSYKQKIEEYINIFKKYNINFKYVNENPEIVNNKYSSYEGKFYYNILLDDKAGFDPDVDWKDINELLNYYIPVEKVA